MNRSLSYCSLLFSLFNVALRSQPLVANPVVGARCETWGHIVGSSGAVQGGTDIEFGRLGSSQRDAQKIHVTPNGSFDLGFLPVGEYRLRVRDSAGALLYDQVKKITAGDDNFFLLLVRDPKWSAAAVNTVSLSELQHKTPRRAWEAYQAAKKAHADGQDERAVESLLSAIEIDPDFAEAHSDLAALYARQGRTEQGLEHAEIAFKLDPRLPEAGANLALLLMNSKRYPDAERIARRLLANQYWEDVSHGVLAVSLIGEHKDADEALRHLGQSASTLPFFRLQAATAFVETGRPDLAVIQVKQYLQTSAHECEKPLLETWVAAVQRRFSLDP
jgi:tetratricopeptide (TPR) repeat protein